MFGSFRSGTRAKAQLNASSVALSMLPLIAVLVVWEACATLSGNKFVPHLAALVAVVVDSFWSDPIIAAQGGGAHGYAPHVFATLEAFLTCFTAGAGIAVVSSVMCFPSIAARGVLRGALRPWHVIPPLIVIPVAFALLGPSRITSWLGGAFYAFISTAILLIAALEQVPANLVHLATLAGAGPLWITWRVRAMSALGVLVGPIKIVGSFTLGVVVMLEYLAVPVGIGRVMKFALAYNAIGLILAGVFWAALIGYTFSIAVDFMRRLFIPWALTGPEAEPLFNLLGTQRLSNS